MYTEKKTNAKNETTIVRTNKKENGRREREEKKTLATKEYEWVK